MFYVYELFDPRTGTTFYVGKGCRDRMHAHEREAARGVRSRKCDKIRELRAAGLEVGKRKVAEFDDEQAAYDFETDAIASIGLEKLTNVFPGGQTAWIDRERLRTEAKAKQDAKKRQSTRKWLKEWLAWADSQPHGLTFPNLKDGDEQAAALHVFVRESLAEPA